MDMPKTLGDLKRMTDANALYALRERCYEEMMASLPVEGTTYKVWAGRYDLVQTQLDDVLYMERMADNHDADQEAEAEEASERRANIDPMGWLTLQPRFVNKWSKRR